MKPDSLDNNVNPSIPKASFFEKNHSKNESWALKSFEIGFPVLLEERNTSTDAMNKETMPDTVYTRI